MSRYRVPIDRHTARNLEILAELWRHGDLASIVASCVRRVTFEEIERARTHTNPDLCRCRIKPDKPHF